MYAEYHWVKASDKKTAKEVNSPRSGSLIFLDPDGTSLGIWDVKKGGEQAFLDAFEAAKKKYVGKEIAWLDGEPDWTHEDYKYKLVVYAFVDDKEPSEKLLKALSHPWISKDHDRMSFIKSVGIDGELAKRFQVKELPTLVFVAPLLKESDRVIDRKSGDVPLRTIRANQKKAFELIKKASESTSKK